MTVAKSILVGNGVQPAPPAKALDRLYTGVGRRLVEQWKQSYTCLHTPLIRSAEAYDAELFVEDLSRWQALRSLNEDGMEVWYTPLPHGKPAVLNDGTTLNPGMMVNVHTGEVRRTDWSLPRLGRQPSNPYVGGGVLDLTDDDSTLLTLPCLEADKYGMRDEWLRRFNRPIARATEDPDGDMEAPIAQAAIMFLTRYPAMSRLWVKDLRVKTFNESYTLTPRFRDSHSFLDLTADHGRQLPMSMRGATVAPHWGMGGEYRVFMVGGLPVTGGYHFDENTPLNATEPETNLRVAGGVFNTLTSDHALRPDQVEAYVRFARRFHEANTTTLPDSYALDVATGEDGPCVVELNAILNSGLFAADTILLYHRLAGDPDSITPTPYMQLELSRL